MAGFPFQRKHYFSCFKIITSNKQNLNCVYLYGYKYGTSDPVFHCVSCFSVICSQFFFKARIRKLFDMQPHSFQIIKLNPYFFFLIIYCMFTVSLAVKKKRWNRSLSDVWSLHVSTEPSPHVSEGTSLEFLYSSRKPKQHLLNVVRFLTGRYLLFKNHSYPGWSWLARPNIVKVNWTELSDKWWCFNQPNKCIWLIFEKQMACT